MIDWLIILPNTQKKKKIFLFIIWSWFLIDYWYKSDPIIFFLFDRLFWKKNLPKKYIVFSVIIWMIEKNTGKCKKTHHFHTKSILSIIDITEEKKFQFNLFYFIHTKKKKERKKIYWHRQGSSHHQMIDDDWIDQQESLLHFFSTILLLSSFFSKTNITNPIKFIGYNFIIGFFFCNHQWFVEIFLQTFKIKDDWISKFLMDFFLFRSFLLTFQYNFRIIKRKNVGLTKYIKCTVFIYWL